MLPPFVPPTARARAESLPLITEFVLRRDERAFEQKMRESLPPISDFMAVLAPPPLNAPAAEPAPVRAPEPETPPPPPPPADAPDERWVAEERNAFDWQSAAGLAVRQGDDRRAEDEWAATDWEGASHPDAEQVASLLTQVVRRVRSGELKVEGIRGMSVEAALAATLAALLRNER